MKNELEEIDVLPPGDWEMASYKNIIIFVSPTHAPRVLEDGKITRLNPIPIMPY